MKDFLGQEYGPGDLVIYGAHSGRSINMVVGRVVAIKEKYYDCHGLDCTFKWVEIGPDTVLPDGLKDSNRKTTVSIQGLRGSRWEQHSNRTYYVDTRTGKHIDRHIDKHILKHAHFVFADGTEYDYDAEKTAHEARSNTGWRRDYISPDFDSRFRRDYHVNYGEVGKYRYAPAERELAKIQLWYVGPTYQPWVEERTEGPKPVSIDITDNIVKWNGDLPEEVSSGEGTDT